MDDASPMTDRRGVVQHAILTIDEPDDGDAITGLGGEILEPRLVVGDEARLQDEVLRGIPGEGELREGHEIATGRVRRPICRNRPCGIALNVADRRIDLGEAERQLAGSRRRHEIRLRPTPRPPSGTSHAVHNRATAVKRRSV